MARPRRGVPVTPFGMWLEGWLTANPNVTFEALGDAIGVTKSAISLWLTATKQARIPIPRLRRIAEATGASVDYLEQLVYGGEGTRAGAPAISPDLLDAMEERMRRAFREELEVALRELRPHEGPG